MRFPARRQSIYPAVNELCWLCLRIREMKVVSNRGVL